MSCDTGVAAPVGRGCGHPGGRTRRTVCWAPLSGSPRFLGPATEGRLAEVVRRVPGLDGADGPTVDGWAQWLRGLYPAEATNRPGWLGTLQPDLLAEDLAVRGLAGWAEARRAGVVVGLSEAQAVQALTVLGRAAAWQPAASGLIDAALAADPLVMADAGIRVARQFPGLLASRLAAMLATADIGMDGLRRLAEQV